MVASTLLNPAFGQANLSNCEREQIHLAGSIQPHGALLLVREPDLEIVQVSANAAEFLGLAESLLGLQLSQIKGDLASRIRTHLGVTLQTIATAVRCRIGEPAVEFDALLHRPVGGGVIIELERAGPKVDVTHQIEGALRAILSAATLQSLAEEAAEIFRAYTGYDRVMVYRFDEVGHGEVFSERRRPDLEAFLGNRYPASDIPQIARRLYERNRVRLIGDINYAPVPLTPRHSPMTGQDLDMSYCFLRSMSPIHVQYLKNMGVAATLVASLVVGGRLWGLISCHHYSPRLIHYEARGVCEVLAEAISTRIAALEGFVQAQATLSVRRIEQRLVKAIADDGDWQGALFDQPQSLLEPLGASGAALLFEGQVRAAGDVPGTSHLREMGRWLDQQPRAGVFATASLGAENPEFEEIQAVASGLLAVPLSNSPGEYLLWFRPEQVRTVTWGGNPFKPMVVGDDPADLSPRRSFAQWHQLVEGTSEPWSQSDYSVGRQVGEILSDVVLQFRSVRTLIVQEQLAQVSQQVRQSEHPVIVADGAGRILVANEAFDRLLQSAHPHFDTIEDLAPYFAEPSKVRQDLRELLTQRRSWRTELLLNARGGQPRALMVRADPVFAAADRVLGFVFLFADLTERKAAEAARRRFQQETIERHRNMSQPLDTRVDLIYRNLMSSLVGNAQIAALEITDGLDLDRVPEMLDSVQSSVARSAELLEHLLWYTSRGGSGD
ncbi:PAS domain-containing protein [Dongia mobilis]|uniref:PAS domain-containing protein n=1 Tax=Dongia mobilis TaxID=578943 RepID=A0A4R6WPE5_9PROT|nr:GAF domain-containing protein [Dongia mobilis]TDQ82965.1 PAS domain-containing protein [Dongia mobilis]